MEISVIGINHRSAAVDVRERFALPNDLAKKLLQAIRAEKIFSEALVLDTCNRTEVYFVSKTQQDSLAHLLGHITQLKQTPPLADTSVFYHHQGLDVVRHLFRVAGTLDSQMVGEHQILGQLKDAYRLALDAGTTRFLLNKLLHWAFRVGKRVQTQTQLGRGSVSIATSAVELAGQIFSKLSGKTVLLVGAGETAELVAKALLRSGVNELIVANRTLSRAERLADDFVQNVRAKNLKAKTVCPASLDEQNKVGPELAGPKAEHGSSTGSQQSLRTRAIGLDEIPAVVGGVDLLICSTGSSEPVLTYQNMANSLRHENHPLLIIDISVPRNVEARLGDLPNVFLYNIDDLDMLVARNLERRREEIPRAEAIIDDEVEQFGKWLNSLQVAPTVKLLQQHFEQLKQAQIVRYGRKFASSEQKDLEEFSRGLCSKILHKPITFLRDLTADSADSEALAIIDAIRQMFDLDTLEQNE
ncbi:MAG: glutamyl-tRNA reductase [Actinobacteria bacterium]|nr:glutamyl-tRNA reductase [Actinomycetota bacterium]